mmetsp:Transcript_35017/g.99610  ORF Transcript_35017/g.99610 Transcript_35017/m.99610 type:complete len:306 (-) Transcript_35017:410-1327(-)
MGLVHAAKHAACFRTRFSLDVLGSMTCFLRSMALRTTSSLSAWRSGIFSSKEAIELTCHMLTLVREHLTPDVVVDSKLSHALWNEIMELSTISCSSKIAPWTSLGMHLDPGLNNNSNCRLIASWQSWALMSLASSPKGFSNSQATAFKHQRNITEKNAKEKVQPKVNVILHNIKGVIAQCKSNKTSQACMYGNGKGILAMTMASWKRVMPLDNSWKARVKIGGAMSNTWFLMFSTMSSLIHWKTSSTLHSAPFTCKRLSRSMPPTSIKGSWRALKFSALPSADPTSSRSASANAWSMLIKRMSLC